MRESSRGGRIARMAVGSTVLLVVALVAFPERSGAQNADSDVPVRVAGTVAEHGTGFQVAQALVRLTREGEDEPLVSAFTDAMGRFLFRRLPAGRYSLRVERLGYRPLEETVTLDAADEVSVRVELTSEAVDVEPLLVTAARVRPPHLVAFDRRREAGFGRFLDREEIEFKRPTVLTDALQTVSGIRVQPDTLRDGTPRPLGYTIRMRAGCEPMLVLDGMSFTREQDKEALPPEAWGLELGVDDLNTLVAPHEVEAIEIYQSGDIPAEFRSDRCGAVVVWTRRGGPEFTGHTPPTPTSGARSRTAQVMLGLVVGTIALLTLR